MRPSRWDEWNVPESDADRPSGGDDELVSRREDTEVADPKAVQPVVAAMAAERGRPILMPLFPVGPLTPQSPCPHYGPIPIGSVLCCMVCHQSGVDGYSAVKRTDLDDFVARSWKPPEGGDSWSEGDVAEPTQPAEGRQPKSKPTRKTKRADRFPQHQGDPMPTMAESPRPNP